MDLVENEKDNREIAFGMKSSAEGSSRNSTNTINSNKPMKRSSIAVSGSQPNLHSMKQLEENKYDTERIYQKFNKMKKAKPKPKPDLGIRPFEPPNLQSEFEANENLINGKDNKVIKPRKLHALQHGVPMISPFSTLNEPIDLNRMDKETLREHLKADKKPLSDDAHQNILKSSVSKAKLKPLAGSSSVSQLPRHKGNHYS